MRKSPCSWKLSNMLLNNLQDKEEIVDIFKLNYYENMTNQNIWDTANIVLTG